MGEDPNEVTVNAWGKSFSIKGIGTIFIVVVVVFATALGLMLYELSHTAAEALKEAAVIEHQTTIEHKAIMDGSVTIKDNQVSIIQGVKDVKESVEVQNYILLEDQRGRDRIKSKIMMPRKLREILNER